MTFVGVLQTLSGCWRLYQENRAVGLYLHYSLYEDPKLQIWGPPLPLVALANVTALLVLAGGIGLCLRAKWGWWIAGFTYSYSVLLSAYMLATSFARGADLVAAGETINVQRFPGLLVICSLLLWYLHSKRVRKSFRLPETAPFRWKAVGIQFGAALLALVVSTLLSYLILSTYGRIVPYFVEV